jgi:hypothetical protein
MTEFGPSHLARMDSRCLAAYRSNLDFYPGNHSPTTKAATPTLQTQATQQTQATPITPATIIVCTNVGQMLTLGAP